jgi:valyl-tRNA synthetase
VLDAILRLLHPFLPFVTEEIADLYGAAPLLARESPVVEAPPGAVADGEAIAAVQGAVYALRAYRADRKVAPGQGLTAVVVADDDAHARLLCDYAPVVRALARTELIAGDGHGDVVIVPGASLYLQTAVDRDTEAAHLRGLLAKLEGEVGRAEAKLADEGFVKRAPEAVVAREREKLAAYKADRDELAARLAELE